MFGDVSCERQTDGMAQPVPKIRMGHLADGSRTFISWRLSLVKFSNVTVELPRTGILIHDQRYS